MTIVSYIAACVSALRVRPAAWLCAALLLLSAGGAIVLALPQCAPLEPEQFRWFWARHYWQSAFDALSAVCGVGLLTRDFEQHYAAAGRWTLWALGQGGAVLYLAALAQIARRAVPSRGNAKSQPSAVRFIAVFACLQAVVIGGAWAITRPALTLADAAQVAGAAFASTGLAPAVEPPCTRASLAAGAGLIGGWLLPLVFIALTPDLLRLVGVRRAVLLAGGYLLLLACAALLITALETPRGPGQGLAGRGDRPLAAGERTLSLLAPRERFTRSVIQAASATTAGIATENLRERDVRDPSKLVLAILVLVGGLGGAAGGGTTFILLMLCLTARRAHSSEPRAFLRSATAIVLLLPALTLVVTFGLLVIEALTASAYQPTFTFAEAFLDAASAVGGANLTSGLTATVTDPNLTRGLGLGVNQYEYAMGWLMSAMLAGRLLPMIIMCRLRPPTRSSSQQA